MRILLFILTMTFATASNAADKTWLIEAYGDSTTLGSHNVGGKMVVDYPSSEPWKVHDILRDDYKINASVPNYGIGGTEASQLLFGDAVHSTWSETMRKSKADIVLLNYAYNDSYYFAKPRSDEIKESPDTFKAMLKILISVAQSYGKIVVLQEPAPNCNSGKPGHKAIDDYVAAIRSAAAETKVPLVPQYDVWQRLPGWKSLLSDCVHPTPPLYLLKAANTAAVLADIIRAMPATPRLEPAKH